MFYVAKFKSGSGSMNEQQRREISSKGGRNSGGSNSNQSGSNSNRGLASADQETRERVAREGGKASHGGGRQ